MTGSAQLQPVYNESLPSSGGDPKLMDVNAIYQSTGYHMVWIMVCRLRCHSAPPAGAAPISDGGKNEKK